MYYPEINDMFMNFMIDYVILQPSRHLDLEQKRRLMALLSEVCKRTRIEFYGLDNKTGGNDTMLIYSTAFQIAISPDNTRLIINQHLANGKYSILVFDMESIVRDITR